MTKSELFKHGDALFQDYSKMNNPFWKECFQYWSDITGNQKIVTSTDLVSVNLWNCTKITINKKPMFEKYLLDRGILCINDILKEDGTFLEFQELKEIMRNNFLLYNAVTGAVKLFIKNFCPSVKIEKIFGPVIPLTCKYLTGKNYKKAYKLLCENDEIPVAQKKFESGNTRLSPENWGHFYSLPHLCTYDTSLIYFQYRVLHRILPTNVYLHKIGIVDSEFCNFCKNQPESLEHLFYDCPFVNNFLDTVVKWLNIDINCLINRTNVLLGWPIKQDNKVFNWFMLQFKYFVYMIKSTNSTLSLNAFKAFLKFRFEVQSKLVSKKRPIEYNDNWRQWAIFLD